MIKSKRHDWNAQNSVKLLKKYLRPIKDKVISVDNETLEVLFKLITLKVDQEFIKQICCTFTLIDHASVSKNMQRSILDAISEVKAQLVHWIRHRQNKQTLLAPASQKSNFVEEIKAQLADDQEIIDTRITYEVRLYSLSVEDQSFEVIVQKIREKSLMLEKSQKLERLLKVFKMLFNQFSKSSREAHPSNEDKAKVSFREDWVKIIAISQLKDLFEVFWEYLQCLQNNKVN